VNYVRVSLTDAQPEQCPAGLVGIHGVADFAAVADLVASGQLHQGVPPVSLW